MTSSWRIRGVTLIAGTGAAPVPGATVTGVANSITSVSTNGQAATDSTRYAFDLDGTGQYLMPGLINAHEHLDMHRTPGTMHQRMEVSHEQLVLRAARNAAWDLALGVTSIRDLGSKDATNIKVRDAIERGELAGPRVIACGQMIAMTGGHGQPLCVEVDGPDSALRETRRQLKLGADVIKVCASGGVVAREREDPWLAELSEDELRVIVGEAHRRSTKVAAHAQPPVAIKMAVAAGVDSIEHGAFLTQECADLMAEGSVFYVPTIGDTVNVVAFGRDLGRPDWMIEAARASLEHRRRAVSIALDSGLRFAIGTDVAGEMGGEMAELVACGMDPMDALVAGTAGGAELLGIADSVGTLEVGKEADMVVLDSDPLADMANLENSIRLVIRQGRPYEPAALKRSWGIPG